MMVFLIWGLRVKAIVILILFSLFRKQEGSRNIQPIPLLGTRGDLTLCPSVLALPNPRREGEGSALCNHSRDVSLSAH